MADAITFNQARAGHASEMFTVKVLSQELSAFPVLTKVTQNIFYIGPPLPEDERNIIIAFDWSEFSGSQKLYSTPQLTLLMMNVLMEPNQLPGFAKPLIEDCWPKLCEGKRTIHFIGHDRGAALLYEVAYWLRGVRTIGQFTTIDPAVYPQTTDTIGVPSNVLFADNYFQTNGLAKGPKLAGAFNQQIITTAGNATANILSWYQDTTRDTAAKGYAFAHCVHGVRPSDGYRTRRVGQPSLQFVYDAATHQWTTTVGGEATGLYTMQTSNDLKTWRETANQYFADGRPSQVTDTVDLSKFANTFYRLESTGVSF